MRLPHLPNNCQIDERPAAHADPSVITHRARAGLAHVAPPRASVRALALAADFDELANIERLQDQHRRELERRQHMLLADQQTCDALQAHLKKRLAQLMAENHLLERLARHTQDT
jgi:hypothetical protein